VLSTVYVNQIIKEKRANSIVIKGLDTVNDSSLEGTAHHLLSTELQIEPNIKHCKRLGRPTTGRIQPLLVVLSSVEEANSVLSVAKNLRHSSNPYVSQCVYICQNLTASEAQAEYEMRCRRRQAAQQRQTATSSAHPHTTNFTHMTHNQSSHTNNTVPSPTHHQQPSFAADINQSVHDEQQSFVDQPADVAAHSDSTAPKSTNISYISPSYRLAAAIPSTSRASEQQSSA